MGIFKVSREALREPLDRLKPIMEQEPFDLEAAIDALLVTDGQRQCIRDTFAQAGIVDLTGVENAPISLGHICGLDIYQVIARLTGN